MRRARAAGFLQVSIILQAACPCSSVLGVLKWSSYYHLSQVNISWFNDLLSYLPSCTLNIYVDVQCAFGAASPGLQARSRLLPGQKVYMEYISFQSLVLLQGFFDADGVAEPELDGAMGDVEQTFFNISRALFLSGTACDLC